MNDLARLINRQDISVENSRRGYKIGNLITCAILAALVVVLPLFEQSPFDYWFWLLAGALMLNLALAVRRQKRLNRLSAWRLADSDHFLADIGCHLDRPRLTQGLPKSAAEPLEAIFNSHNLDINVLKPLVKKSLAGLKKALRRQPGHAGAWAYRAFCLALYGQITGRETFKETLSDYPETRWSSRSLRAYDKAAAIGPGEASIWADWGRQLEARANSLSATKLEALDESRAAAMAALEKYDKAIDLDPEFFQAGWGRARIMSREAFMTDQPAAVRDGLRVAVSAYEAVRRGRALPFEFNIEFGQAVFSLARLSTGDTDSYFRYAARLFIMAAENKPEDNLPRCMAGQALFMAACMNEDRAPETARELYHEALAILREAANLNKSDHESRREAVRCLTSLFNLAPAAEKAEGGQANGLLAEAAILAAQAAALVPGEETWSDSANVIAMQAEHSAEDKAGLLWAEAAGLHEQAARDRAASKERAAVNWHNWGYALTALAGTKPKSARLQLLKMASRKYARAASLSRDNLVTLENWGDLLGDLAAMTTDPAQAARLRDQAEGKFRLAARLHQGQASPFRHWSAHHQALARTERNPARRRELWKAALDKLEEAAKANPGDAPTWLVWGRLFLELMGEGPDYERPLLLAGALEKLEKALNLDSKSDETWTWLGRAHLEASELSEELNFSGGPLHNAVLAGEHFKTACNLNPSEAGHWAAWGQSLFRVAQLIDNEASVLAALKEAYEKYLTAAALDPDEGGHQTDLGHVLYHWGWCLEDNEAKADHFKKAYEHCGEARRLAPDNPMVWRNWAKVTEALASMEDDPLKSSAWQNEADEKYYQADALEVQHPLRH